MTTLHHDNQITSSLHDFARTHGGPDAHGVPRWDFSTNANACGPAPMALEMVRQVDARRYPDPTFSALRRQLGQLHQVDSGFGMAAPGQYAAGAGTQREDMAWAMQIRRPGAVGNGGLDGGDAVGGGDTRGDALGRFYGHGEGGLIMAGVRLHHHGQLELAYPLVGQAEADDAGAFADHHGHLFVGHGFCGEDEVTLVLPIFIIGHQHALTGTQCGQRGFDAGNGITKFTE